MPQGVGRCAEQALRGCMERSVPSRWTVAMVDEVAWGIGCDSPADDAPYPNDLLPPTRSRSQSRPASVPEHALADDDGHAVGEDLTLYASATDRGPQLRVDLPLRQRVPRPFRRHAHRLSIIQLVALIWYLVSYFPMGSQGLRFAARVGGGRIAAWMND